ncbi:MAG: SAM-dependent methyltransferase [Chitinophagaceae bacterium]|nr:MAG: SAM-dependent methyltransferase [Chitinophagaceae bacterium]
MCAHSYERFIDDLPSGENRDAIEKNNVIAGYGKNIICPNCFSTARERLVLIMLNEHFKVEGMKVLHLSPEKHTYNFLKQKAEVITADLRPGFYKHIDAGAREVDLMKLPFTDDTFDLVIANHILEHIPDDARAMQEIYRVMKSGARAILQVPYSESISTTLEDPLIHSARDQSKLFGQKDHVRIYAFNDYIGRLRKAGFTVNVLRSHELDVYAMHAIQEGEHFLMIYK